MNIQEQQIIDNLKEFHSGKWVSSAVAVWRCETTSGFTALQKLIKKGIIKRKSINGYPYVRYIEPFVNLKVVK